jgi:RNA polymerase-binding transcription factor DksA
VSWPLAEPLNEPRDEGDIAADVAQLGRDVAIRAHLARVQVGEDQIVDPDGRVLCLWCFEPVEPERLRAVPTATRHEECQLDYEQSQRRQG